MIDGGWIKLHRSMTKNFIYSFDEPDKTLAWIDLLFMARYEDGKILIKGQVVSVKRGQVAMSQTALQKRWRWSQNKLKRFLLLLQKEEKISFTANELTTVISICNYSQYQDYERPDERPDERATDDQTDEDIRKKEGKKVRSKSAGAKFTPPTLGDIRGYMASRGVNDRDEVEKFHDFYESKGWMVGKTKMKDWKAAVRNWLRNSDTKTTNNDEGVKWITPAN